MTVVDSNASETLHVPSSPERTGAKAGASKASKSARVTALLAIAGAAAVLAFFVFPKDDPVSASLGTGNLILEGNYPITEASAEVLPYRNGAGTEVLVALESLTIGQQSPWERLNIDEPKEVACPHLARCRMLGRETKSVAWFFQPWSKNLDSNGFHETSLRVFLPSNHYTVTKNAEYVAANLPEVAYYQFVNGNLVKQDLPLAISLAIPSADEYAWASGAAPALSPRLATWSYESAPDASQAVSGVNLRLQDRDGKLLFVAGALLGIAGAALIGAVQERFLEEGLAGLNKIPDVFGQ